MRVLAWRTTVKCPPLDGERHTGSPQPVRERRVGERDHDVAGRFKVTMEIADQMADARRFLEAARPRNDDVFGRRRDDVRPSADTMEQLARHEYGPGRELERQPRAVRRVEQTPDTPAIVRRHRQFDGDVRRFFARPAGGRHRKLLNDYRVDHLNPGCAIVQASGGTPRPRPSAPEG